MHKHVVHSHHDAVAVHPKVLPVAVVPVPIDPNTARAGRNLLLDDDDLGRWRGLHRGGDGLGLLDDDDGLAVDLFGRALFGFDYHVVGRVGRRGGLPLANVAIMRRVRLPAACLGAVAIRDLVLVGGYRKSKSHP